MWWVITQINTEAPFAAAFEGGTDGWKWVSNVVGVGASLGILTSMLVSMLGQARYMCVIGRSSVIPAWFARVHPRTSTPVNATLFLGNCSPQLFFLLVNCMHFFSSRIRYFASVLGLYRLSGCE